MDTIRRGAGAVALAVVLVGITGCTGVQIPAGSPSPTASGATPTPTAASTSEPSSTPSDASPAVTPAGDPGDLNDPCTLLSADQINGVLGTSFSDGQSSEDSARQIVTCKYTSDDMTQIVGVTVSKVDGAKSFKLNRDLAVAYFDGKPQPVTIPGAEQAYRVIAETFNAPVVGMLVRGHFVLVQVGVEGATPEQGADLAAQTAARVP